MVPRKHIQCIGNQVVHQCWKYECNKCFFTILPFM